MGQLPYFAFSVLSFPPLSFNFISREQHRIWDKMGKAGAMLLIVMISAATTMPMLVLSCDSPPAATPPSVPGSGSSPPGGESGGPPSSSPPGGRSGGPPSVPGSGSSLPGGRSYPLDALEVGACVDLLGGLVHLGIGDPVVNQCCPLIQGVAELEAALCLCTTIRLKLLNVNVILPLALDLFVQCGVTPPPGFTCPPLN